MKLRSDYRNPLRRHLEVTALESEQKQIKAALDRHERAVAALRKAGWNYDDQTGKLSPPAGQSPGATKPKDNLD